MIINLPQYQNIIWCPFNILSKSCPIPTHIISQSVSFPNNVTNTNHFQAVLLVFSICFLHICSFLSLIISQMLHFTISLLLLMKCSHHGYDSAAWQSRSYSMDWNFAIIQLGLCNEVSWYQHFSSKACSLSFSVLPPHFKVSHIASPLTKFHKRQSFAFIWHILRQISSLTPFLILQMFKETLSLIVSLFVIFILDF